MMRKLMIVNLLIYLTFLLPFKLTAQRPEVTGNEKKIDSLILLLKEAGREWNEYANQLKAFGEPAVPALLSMLKDKHLAEWPRRLASMTLVSFHSEKCIPSCMKILLDESENQTIRNGMCAILKGFDLTPYRNQLWNLFQRSESWFQSNLAGLLNTSDPELAFIAYQMVYDNMDGYARQQALIKLLELRPEKSNQFLMKGLQDPDWMTGNLAMDSLITSKYLIPSDMLSLFHDANTPEEVRWRIVYIFSHRSSPESAELFNSARNDASWLVRMEAKLALTKFP